MYPAPSRTLAVLALALLPGQLWSQEQATLSVATGEDYGDYIVGPDGLPLYTLLTDLEAGDGEDPLASCHEECRRNWPVLVAQDEMKAGDGLDPALLETIDWRGEEVVTYAGHPLFHFADDRPHGEPGGQGMFTYGGYWALLSPRGRPLRTDAMPEGGQDQTPLSQSRSTE